MQEKSLDSLLGQIIALTYALNVTLKNQPNGDAVAVEIGALLAAVEKSMKESNSAEAAAGVARIRKALLGQVPTLH